MYDRGGVGVTTPKVGKYLTTVPVCAWGIADKLSGLLKRKDDAGNTAVLDNLQRLQELRKAGVITNEEYETLKARLMEHIR